MSRSNAPKEDPYVRAVQSVMRGQTASVEATTTLSTVHRIFVETEVAAAAVVDAAGRVVGEITGADLLRAIASSAQGTSALPKIDADWSSCPDDFQDVLEHATVECWMSKEVVLLDASAPVAHAAQLLRDASVQQIFITEKACLVGIVTALDVLELIEPVDGHEAHGSWTRRALDERSRE